MHGLGFHTLLPDALQAPTIVTFLTPADTAFRFEEFYAALAGRGYLIYPGKLTKANSFRIGCMGALGEPEIRGVVAAVAEVIREMGVTRTAPG
jgi:2-aminoethylphosphonate-pyruvate transaminase